MMISTRTIIEGDYLLPSLATVHNGAVVGVVLVEPDARAIESNYGTREPGEDHAFRSEVSSSTTNQVPFLGSLPLAGYLFRKQNDNTNREEVIILLTPHIIKDQAAYAQNSERLLKEGEKLRVGRSSTQRQGIS